MNPWCQVGAAYEAFPSSYGGPEAMNSNSVYAAAYQAAYAAAVAATGAAQHGDAAAPAAFGAHAMMAPMIGYMPMMVPQVGGSTGENLWYLFARVAHHMSGFELDCEVMLKYRFVYIFAGLFPLHARRYATAAAAGPGAAVSTASIGARAAHPGRASERAGDSH